MDWLNICDFLYQNTFRNECCYFFIIENFKNEFYLLAVLILSHMNAYEETKNTKQRQLDRDRTRKEEEDRMIREEEEQRLNSENISVESILRNDDDERSDQKKERRCLRNSK